MKKLLTFIFIITISLLTSAQQYSSTPYAINSKILNETRNITVYTPAGYENSGKGYPVVYLFDASNHEVYLPGLGSFLARNGVISDFIIVAIYNTQRTRDFTPEADPEREESGGGKKFYNFMNEELLPFVKTNYRTVDYNIVMGHSLTGMYSMYLVHTYPEQFKAAVAASPFVQYYNNFLARYTKNELNGLSDEPRTIFFSVGSTETPYFEPLDEIKEIYKNSGDELSWGFVEYEGYNHGLTPLLTFYEGLEFIFNDWKLPEELGDDPVTLIKDHFNSIEEKYGVEVNPSEQLMNALGYRYLGQEKVELAEEIFELNIELYPNSANVYDSYGELLEQTGRKEEAAENYGKAVENAEKSNDANLELFKKNYERVKGS